jgi:hypothetical protein
LKPLSKVMESRGTGRHHKWRPERTFDLQLPFTWQDFRLVAQAISPQAHQGAFRQQVCENDEREDQDNAGDFFDRSAYEWNADSVEHDDNGQEKLGETSVVKRWSAVLSLSKSR